MNLKLLSILICPNCTRPGFDLQKFVYKKDRVVDGRLVCPKCKNWFRVENDIVDLLPPHLRRYDRYQIFAKKYLLPYEEKEPAGQKVEQGKLSQINFFKDAVLEYERTVVNNNYYRAIDSFFDDWILKNVRAGDRVLNLGSGTARQAIPLAKRGANIVEVDIAEEMLLLAREKLIKEDILESASLIVADAEDPPIVDNYFQLCVFYGTLHHLPKPAKAIGNASKKLDTGGLMYTFDPNSSPLRFLFDILMSVWRLYREDTGKGKHVSRDKLQKWLKKTRMEGTISFSTYFPPHVFQFTSLAVNKMFLKYSDLVFGGIPIVNSFGGMIIFKGKKV